MTHLDSTTRRRLGRLLVAATALAGSVALFGSAAAAATATSSASAQVSTAIAITNTAALDFGKFLASGTAGTVVMSAAGSRSATGGVTLIASARGAASGFSVTGEPSTSYAITLPASAITLTSGANTMSVDTFTDSKGGTSTLDGTGADTFGVGATLSVGASQATGTYTGSFDVSVDYN